MAIDFEFEYFKNEKINDRFEEFKNLLLEKNKIFNLTSITDDLEIYVKHFYDSIKGGERIDDFSNVLEIGSGGGFPSVPLKLFRDDLRFTLVESTLKKCVFLEEVKRKLQLENFEIINNRCEDLARNKLYRERFDFVVARAVAPLRTLCEYMLPFAKVGGFMLAFKGNAEKEIVEAENAIKTLGGKLKEIYFYSLPLGFGERSVVVIEKVEKTPEIYPRGRGKERSKPL